VLFVWLVVPDVGAARWPASAPARRPYGPSGSRFKSPQIVLLIVEPPRTQ
jgi:hypothetical protein